VQIPTPMPGKRICLVLYSSWEIKGRKNGVTTTRGAVDTGKREAAATPSLQWTMEKDMRVVRQVGSIMKSGRNPIQSLAREILKRQGERKAVYRI